jgi:anti-sigma regulatory factor (Ser/Thr protein kinase)
MLPARSESEATLQVRAVLRAHLSELITGAVLDTALRRAGCSAATLRFADIPLLLEALERGSHLFLGSPAQVAAMMRSLSQLDLGRVGARPASGVHPVASAIRPASQAPERPTSERPERTSERSPEDRKLASGSFPVARRTRGQPEMQAPRGPSARGELPLPTAASLSWLLIRGEDDIATARAAARQAAVQVMMPLGVQTLAAAVVSELARNLLRYAGGGDIELSALAAPHHGIDIVARDRGPGIADQEHALQSGRDAGLRGIERIASYFHAHTTPGRGTLVCVQVKAR